MTSLAAINVKPYILAYKISNGIQKRHLADFDNPTTRDNFGKFIINLGGSKAPNDDWYMLPKLEEFYKANTEARKHGHVYELPDHEHGVPPHGVHYHTLAFKVDKGETYRQLSDFESLKQHGDFVDYLKLKAGKKDDWWTLTKEEDIKPAIAKAFELKGHVYNLPIAPDLDSEALE